MKVGDIVFWKRARLINMILEKNTSHRVTGIVIDVRTRHCDLQSKYGKVHEANVLCKSGALRWFPASQLEVLT